MFGWSRPKPSAQTMASAAPVAASPAPTAAPSASADNISVKDLPVEAQKMASGCHRADPAAPEEFEFAERMRTSAKNCYEIFLQPSFDLPTLPASGMRLIDLMQDPNTSPRKIAHSVEQDPVLTAKFLRLANSPAYCGSRRVEAVQVAIDRLGFATVRGIVLAISLNNTLIKDKRLGAMAQVLWKHSIDTALAVQNLATRLKMNATSAFTLGLMHDVGKIPAYLLSYKSDISKIRRELVTTMVEDVHTQMGLALAKAWHMPVEVQLVAGGHHVGSSLSEIMNYNRSAYPTASESEAQVFAKLVGCTIIADQALGALGLADEFGELTIGGPCLAAELGLDAAAVMDFLGAIPKIIADNNLNSI